MWRRPFGPGLDNVAGNDLHEEVGRRLGVDVAAHWRPTAENFFKRLKKDRALAIAEEVLGETPDAGEPVPGEPAPDDLPEAFRGPA